MTRYALKDICTELHSGKGISSSEISDAGNYPVIGGNGVRGYTTKSNFSGECAVIGRQGAACGNVRFFSGDAYMTEHAVIARGNSICDSRYLAYALGQMHLGRLSAQSAQPGLSVKTLGEQVIELPAHEEQEAIVDVLGKLDDKIALNSQINGYLEELLLARYDELFGSFDSSACNGKLADIGEVIGGATPSKKRADYYSRDGIGWITPRDLSNTNKKFIAHGADDITQAGYDSCSARLLRKGSVLFSSRAPIGYVAIADDELVTNQGFKSVVPKLEVGTAFVYCFLKRSARRIADMGAGTTFPEVSGKMMKAVELKLPELETCKSFSAFAKPLLYMQRKCEAENTELESLRDALLPRLMSGEIGVSKVGLTQLNSHLSGC